ncbi:MAG: M3 family metallopeptidase, partial [Planctomycetota bacterium]
MTATIEKPEQKRIELPARSEVAQSDQWDLKSLFTDEAAWEEAFTEGEGRIAALKSFAGRLGEGAQVLRELLDLDTDTDRLVSRLYNYAARRSDEDTSNSHYQGLRERCQNLVTRLSEAMSFFSPELLGLSEETLEGYLGAEELAPFKFTLEKVIRRKPHTLSQSEERLLAMAGEVTNAPYQIFGQLSNADLKFGFITDENGNEVEVTHGSYTVFLNKRDRAIREKFFKTYYQGFESHKHTLSAALQAGIKRDVFYAKAKNHASARSAALFRNNVPEAVYDNLIEAVHENLGGLYKYYELRRELLGLDEIHFYDLFVSVVPDLKMRHT